MSCTSVMRAYFITQSSGEAGTWCGVLILTVDLTLALTQSSGEAGTSTPPLCPLLAPLWPAWRDEAWPSSACAALGEGQGRGRV